MAAKGSIAKEEIIAKILETFQGSFKYDKEIRIPVFENGEPVQIKVTLTCAKTNVENDENDGGVAVFSETKAAASASTPVTKTSVAEPTAEEKQAVADLCAKLGLTQ
jgi:flagella basal body P-ring formation protein FlgA